MKIIGLKIIKKEIFKNSKGDIIKYISKRDKIFKKFGEVYFSEIKKNKTKGWNLHKKNYCLVTVPIGEVIFTFFDGRKNSRTFKTKHKIILGKKKHRVVLIPPGIWFSFTTGSKKALVANILNNVHSPKETDKATKLDLRKN